MSSPNDSDTATKHILEYYQKFSQNRNLPKYFSGPSVSYLPPHELPDDKDENSQQSNIKIPKIRIQADPTPIKQPNSTNKNISKHLEVPHMLDDVNYESENSSSPSINKNKLEWDSGADIGYLVCHDPPPKATSPPFKSLSLPNLNKLEETVSFDIFFSAASVDKNKDNIQIILPPSTSVEGKVEIVDNFSSRTRTLTGSSSKSSRQITSSSSTPFSTKSNSRGGTGTLSEVSAKMSRNPSTTTSDSEDKKIVDFGMTLSYLKQKIGLPGAHSTPNVVQCLHRTKEVVVFKSSSSDTGDSNCYCDNFQTPKVVLKEQKSKSSSQTSKKIIELSVTTPFIVDCPCSEKQERKSKLSSVHIQTEETADERRRPLLYAPKKIEENVCRFKSQVKDLDKEVTNPDFLASKSNSFEYIKTSSPPIKTEDNDLLGKSFKIQAGSILEELKGTLNSMIDHSDVKNGQSLRDRTTMSLKSSDSSSTSKNDSESTDVYVELLQKLLQSKRKPLTSKKHFVKKLLKKISTMENLEESRVKCPVQDKKSTEKYKEVDLPLYSKTNESLQAKVAVDSKETQEGSKGKKLKVQTFIEEIPPKCISNISSSSSNAPSKSSREDHKSSNKECDCNFSKNDDNNSIFIPIKCPVQNKYTENCKELDVAQNSKVSASLEAKVAVVSKETQKSPRVQNYEVKTFIEEIPSNSNVSSFKSTNASSKSSTKKHKCSDKQCDCNFTKRDIDTISNTKYNSSLESSSSYKNWREDKTNSEQLLESQGSEYLLRFAENEREYQLSWINSEISHLSKLKNILQLKQSRASSGRKLKVKHSQASPKRTSKVSSSSNLVLTKDSTVLLKDLTKTQNSKHAETADDPIRSSDGKSSSNVSEKDLSSASSKDTNCRKSGKVPKSTERSSSKRYCTNPVTQKELESNSLKDFSKRKSSNEEIPKHDPTSGSLERKSTTKYRVVEKGESSSGSTERNYVIETRVHSIPSGNLDYCIDGKRYTVMQDRENNRDRNKIISADIQVETNERGVNIKVSTLCSTCKQSSCICKAVSSQKSKSSGSSIGSSLEVCKRCQCEICKCRVDPEKVTDDDINILPVRSNSNGSLKEDKKLIEERPGLHSSVEEQPDSLNSLEKVFQKCCCSTETQTCNCIFVRKLLSHFNSKLSNSKTDQFAQTNTESKPDRKISCTEIQTSNKNIPDSYTFTQTTPNEVNETGTLTDQMFKGHCEQSSVAVSVNFEKNQNKHVLRCTEPVQVQTHVNRDDKTAQTFPATAEKSTANQATTISSCDIPPRGLQFAFGTSEMIFESGKPIKSSEKVVPMIVQTDPVLLNQQISANAPVPIQVQTENLPQKSKTCTTCEEHCKTCCSKIQQTLLTVPSEVLDSHKITQTKHNVGKITTQTGVPSSCQSTQAFVSRDDAITQSILQPASDDAAQTDRRHCMTDKQQSTILSDFRKVVCSREIGIGESGLEKNLRNGVCQSSDLKKVSEEVLVINKSCSADLLKEKVSSGTNAADTFARTSVTSSTNKSVGSSLLDSGSTTSSPYVVCKRCQKKTPISKTGYAKCGNALYTFCNKCYWSFGHVRACVCNKPFEDNQTRDQKYVCTCNCPKYSLCQRTACRCYNNSTEATWRCCQFCQFNLTRGKNDENGIAYTLVLEEGTPIKREKREKKKKDPEVVKVKIPKVRCRKEENNKENIYRKNGASEDNNEDHLEEIGFGKSPDEKGSEECKDDVGEKYTLKEYLIKNKPEFIYSAEYRRQMVLTSRIFREQKRDGLKLNFLKNLEFCEHPGNLRLFSGRKMKEITRKNYKKLPEVQQKLIDRRKQTLRDADKLISDLFAKTVQNSVLRGQRNFPIDRNLIQY